MNNTIKSLSAGVFLLGMSITTSNAAISFILNQAATTAGSAVLNDAGGGWDFEAGGPWANVYWDANQNGTFGEAGENSGDTNATLDITAIINDAFTMNFAVEGFDGATESSSGFRFDIENSDTTTQTVTAVLSGPTAFFDSNGDEWSVAYAFIAQGYGDVVSNLDSAPGGSGGGADHQAVLTFTAIPEPSSAALLGLGGLALILRRRK